MSKRKSKVQLGKIYRMEDGSNYGHPGMPYKAYRKKEKYDVIKFSKSKTKASVKCWLAPKWHFRVSLRNVKDSSSPSYCLLEASSPSITGNPEWVDSLAEAPTCPLAIWTNRKPLRGNPTIFQILYFYNLLSMRY